MRKMKKIVVLGLVTLASACYPQAHVSLANWCEEARFEVSWLEGSGNWKVLENHLMPGDRTIIEFTGTSGQRNKFVLSLDGFSVESGKPYASISEDLLVYPIRGESTAPRYNEAWTIECRNGRVWIDEA